MAPNHSRSARRGDQLRLATTTINRHSRCARPNRRQGRALPEQFFHQWSFQHHAFGSHSNADSDTNGNTYCYSNSNADPECYTNSDSYCDSDSYRDANGYTYNYAETHADAKASSDSAATTVTPANMLGFLCATAAFSPWQSSTKSTAVLVWMARANIRGAKDWGRTFPCRLSKRVLSRQGRAFTIWTLCQVYLGDLVFTRMSDP